MALTSSKRTADFCMNINECHQWASRKEKEEKRNIWLWEICRLTICLCEEERRNLPHSAYILKKKKRGEEENPASEREREKAEMWEKPGCNLYYISEITFKLWKWREEASEAAPQYAVRRSLRKTWLKAKKLRPDALKRWREEKMRKEERKISEISKENQWRKHEEGAEKIPKKWRLKMKPEGHSVREDSHIIEEHVLWYQSGKSSKREIYLKKKSLEKMKKWERSEEEREERGRNSEEGEEGKQKKPRKRNRGKYNNSYEKTQWEEIEEEG